MPKYSPNLNDIEHDFSALKRARMICLSIHILIKLFVIIVPNIVLSLFQITIIVLIKIETKIEYNKIKSTRNYFELCLTV